LGRRLAIEAVAELVPEFGDDVLWGSGWRTTTEGGATMRRHLGALLALVLAGAIGVGGAAASSAKKPNKKAASYEFLAGADSAKPGGFALCSIPVTNPCPDVARAANGDTVTIAGAGMLSVHPKSVSGSGTYSSTNTDVGSGTWAAVKLLSFKAYGTNDAVTLGATAGKALIRVQLSNGAMGVLRITCRLPGTKVPHSFHEGVRLALESGPNFNKEAGGVTLYIRQ
jgi:hypothetical protein